MPTGTLRVNTGKTLRCGPVNALFAQVRNRAAFESNVADGTEALKFISNRAPRWLTS